ncbi:MAG TPA: methylated-DNA--[protein]-cysteine S-methyltransferase [Polyangia bacterium]|nr:methylated-DNA--[protein]-cysteine S-methyltransferase [Polyangia bacterium]
MIQVATLPSPLGPLVIASGPAGICGLSFAERWPQLRAQLRARFEQRFPARPTAQKKDPWAAAERLDAYFAGRLDALDDLPVDPAGTAFQLRVWTTLRRIRVGTTWSYERLAREVGAAGCARAAGAANGQNPIPLVLPCHRVIGKDGSLRGYGGGLARKSWLLTHERARFRAGP